MLSELHQRILRGDPELAVRSAGRRPGRAAPPDTLPPETAEFVGRREELGLLTEEHGDTPGIALIEGMPGVGKTALAVRRGPQVCGQYPDGTALPAPCSHGPGQPALDAAEALQRLLQDADRARRSDTGHYRRACRALAGPAEPPSRRRDPRRRGRARPDPTAAAGGRPVPDPDHHPAQASGPTRAPAR